MINQRLIKRYIKKYINYIKWYFSAIMIPFIDVGDVLESNILDEKGLRKTLILAPHSDDEWIGCSQIIKKSEDVTVYYFNFLGKNYSNENEHVRLQELKNLQQLFGFKLIVSDYREDYTDLEKLILENEFSSIFIPCPIDWHIEHILVNKIVCPILEKASYKNIPFYFYKVSVPLVSKLEKKFLPMNKYEIQEKKTVFEKIYHSQRNIPIKRMILQNKFSATKSKYLAIEPYAIINLDTLKELLHYIDLHYKKEFKPLAHIIDSPIKIRRICNSVYMNFIKFTNKNQR